MTEGPSNERIAVNIFSDPAQVAAEVAGRIRTLVIERAGVGKKTVLGLPTGSTPLGVYQELIKMHREGLDFSSVVAFSLDEYYPISPSSVQSYHNFIHTNLFDFINIPADQIYIPRGDVPADQLEASCKEYEGALRAHGGFDLVLLGIGRSGHIGFNEPGSRRSTRTRVVSLTQLTRKDAASHFFGDANVPRHAITIGVGTILDAEEIILMATGEHKANIIRRAVEGPISEEVVASFLQEHSQAALYVDEAAASELTRSEKPWLVYDLDWDYDVAKRAVLWLSEHLGKALLRLEAADFHNNNLHTLVYAYPDVDQLCLQVFDDLRQRIRYLEDLPKKQRAVLFSPHPDDDVISMGGMLDKVVRNENHVIVAYMTNGSVAVFDEDLERYLGFVEMSLQEMGLSPKAAESFRARKERIEEFLRSKKPGAVDLEEIQYLKANIRYSEAIAGIKVLGLSEEHARFLDLPFYQTGRIKKKAIGDADVSIILDLLREQRPQHIFVAGDLSDPHGTHRMCYVAIQRALALYHKEQADRPLVWLYRGAWQEWEIHKADVFVPVSKAEMTRKIEAIFKHESQKDRAMFPGAHDEREFWQRARDRNTDTATALNRLGLPEFYAAEAFVTSYDL